MKRKLGDDPQQGNVTLGGLPSDGSSLRSTARRGSSVLFRRLRNFSILLRASTDARENAIAANIIPPTRPGEPQLLER